jgi:hypothetical protein
MPLTATVNPKSGDFSVIFIIAHWLIEKNIKAGPGWETEGGAAQTDSRYNVEDLMLF